MGMNSDLAKVLSSEDSEILVNAVERVEKVDLGALAQEFDRYVKSDMLPNAIKVQWQIVGALSRTTVHLEKQNLLMEQDYKRRGLGRKS